MFLKFRLHLGFGGSAFLEGHHVPTLIVEKRKQRRPAGRHHLDDGVLAIVRPNLGIGDNSGVISRCCRVDRTKSGRIGSPFLPDPTSGTIAIARKYVSVAANALLCPYTGRTKGTVAGCAGFPATGAGLP
jgi:hypothetical protein